MRLLSVILLTLFISVSFTSFCVGQSTETMVTTASTPSGQTNIAELLDQRIFQSEQLVRIALPEEAGGNWAVVDDMGRRIRYGMFRKGERALYLGDLQPGIYYLFWEIKADQTPSVSLGPENRLDFLVLPESPAPMTDHFFAVRQPHLLYEIQQGQNDAEATVKLAAMMGAPRLRLFVDAPTVRDRENPTEIDWATLDALEREATERGVRFIAVLTGNPRHPVDPVQSVATSRVNQAFVQALLRRYGFKFDAFALHSAPNDPEIFAGSIEEMASFLGPVVQELKLRSPFSTVSLGGLKASEQKVGFMGETERLRRMLALPFDQLDWEAAGTLHQTRALSQELQVLITDTPAAAKPQSISNAPLGSVDDSINGQRFQASQMLKKMVWSKFRNLPYFTADYLVEPHGESLRRSGLIWRGPEGNDLRPRMQAAVWAVASRRFANATPAPDKVYAGQSFEMYAFARKQGTVLVAWVPELPNDTRPDKRAVVTLKWPDGASARVSNMLGRALPANYLQRQDEGVYNVVADVDPIFIELNVAPDSVGW